MEEYRKKLIEWNSRDKYMRELNFLGNLMNLNSSDSVLDYGCGTMKAIKHFNENYECHIKGFDVNEYAEKSDYIFYDNSLKGNYNKVYLNHVIAHVSDVKEMLNSLKKIILGGRIYVITPNKLWLKYMKNEKYNPDKTVINHFSLPDLVSVFRQNGFTVIRSGQFGEFLNEERERLFLEATI